MADLKATISVPSRSATTSVSKPSSSAQARISVEALEDYFEWTQDTFDPLNHWPLNEDVGSTEVLNMGGGPNGDVYGDILEGDSLIRSHPEHKCAVKPDGVSGRIEFPSDTGDFVWKTGVFTIGWWWYLDAAQYAIPISNTDRFGAGDAGFMISNRNDNIPKMVVRLDDGTAYGSSEDRFWRDLVELDGIQEIEHLMWVGTGDVLRVYRNGMMTSEWDWPDNVERDLDPSYPLCAFDAGDGSGGRAMHGRMSGLIIDDRAWSTAEIKAHYERGLGVKELGIFQVPDSAKTEDLYTEILSKNPDLFYQGNYLQVGDNESKYQDDVAVNPVIKSGQRIAKMRDEATGTLDIVAPSESVQPEWVSVEDGVYFDGVDKHLRQPDFTSLGGTTIIIRMNPDFLDDGYDQRFLSSVDGNRQYRFNSGKPEVATGSGTITYSTALDAEDLIVGFAVESGNSSIYVPGLGIETFTGAVEGDIEGLNIGKQNKFFQGYINIVGVWDRRVSDAELIEFTDLINES